MSRKYLAAAKCSQMTSPKTGTGSGRDACTEADVTMIDITYGLGPKARAAKTMDDAEAILNDLIAYLNPTHPTYSAMENLGVWFPAWLKRYGYDKLLSLSNMHNPNFSNVKEVIDRQQIAVIGVNDYRHLTDYSGGNPFTWNALREAPAGHVLLLVGYDDNFRDKYGQTVIVHDSLRAYDGMPWDYSFKSLQAAGFSDLTEIVGPKLPYVVNSDTAPVAPPDPATQLAAWQAFGDSVEKLLLTFPKPPA